MNIDWLNGCTRKYRYIQDIYNKNWTFQGKTKISSYGESEILSDGDIQNPQMCTNNTDNMLLHNMDQWTKIHKYVMYTSVQAHIKLKWILASRNLTKINI